jgi:hypothetical protein
VSVEVKAERRKPDHKRYLVVQSVLNLIGVAVVVAFLAWLVFGLFGPGSGTLIEVRAFLFWFLLCFVVIQCHTAVINTRRDFIRGRWRMGDPGGIEPDGVISPWKRIGPPALPVAVAVALGAWFLLPLSGGADFPLLKVELFAFVPLLLVSTVLIAFLLPRDQVSFAAALERGSEGAVPSVSTYLVLEHLLPWAVIQGLINMGIGAKQFSWALEGTNPAESVGSSLVGWDFGIVFGILYFFMFIASDGQVRADVRLGRLAPRPFKISRLGRLGVPAIAVGVVVTTVLIMIAVGLAMQGIFAVAGIEGLPFATSVALKTLAAVFGTLVGCSVGVWWGRRAESALMAGAG